jgi:hypothetical protein
MGIIEVVTRTENTFSALSCPLHAVVTSPMKHNAGGVNDDLSHCFWHCTFIALYHAVKVISKSTRPNVFILAIYTTHKT